MSPRRDIRYGSRCACVIWLRRRIGEGAAEDVTVAERRRQSLLGAGRAIGAAGDERLTEGVDCRAVGSGPRVVPDRGPCRRGSPRRSCSHRGTRWSARLRLRRARRRPRRGAIVSRPVRLLLACRVTPCIRRWRPPWLPRSQERIVGQVDILSVGRDGYRREVGPVVPSRRLRRGPCDVRDSSEYFTSACSLVQPVARIAPGHHDPIRRVAPLGAPLAISTLGKLLVRARPRHQTLRRPGRHRSAAVNDRCDGAGFRMSAAIKRARQICTL